MEIQQLPVGFFDSGLGGISVLRETVRLLPQEDYLYYGDSLHAPYGTRSTQEVESLVSAAAEHLISRGVKAIVVACNTATSVAIRLLRAASEQSRRSSRQLKNTPADGFWCLQRP